MNLTHEEILKGLNDDLARFETAMSGNHPNSNNYKAAAEQHGVTVSKIAELTEQEDGSRKEVAKPKGARKQASLHECVVDQQKQRNKALKQAADLADDTKRGGGS